MNTAIPPSWDLSDLFASPDDSRIEDEIRGAHDDAIAFREMYRGRVGSLAPQDLLGALRTIEAIFQRTAKLSAYASLRFAAESTAASGAFFQRIRERTTEATLPLVFFDVELAARGASALRLLAEEDALRSYRHYLQTVAARAAHRLTEAEERLYEEQANTGSRAFVRLYEELMSRLQFTMPDSDVKLSLPQIIDRQSDPDRSVRESAAKALTDGLAAESRTVAFIYNTLLQDKATQGRIRGLSYPEEARHISNELDRATVDTVVDTAVAGYPLVARYYDIKRRLLGLPHLAHYDRYAPLVSSDTERRVSFGEARETVLTAFARFDAADFAPAASRFFESGWIDAAERKGKRGGAFCSYVTPDTHPYLFLNFLDKPNDVRTLAHELGHGVHSYLSRGQTFFNYHGTLPMAEVASTFAEMLVFEEQMRTADDAQRLAAYAHQIEQSIATIFRQAAMYRFEQTVHVERQEAGELSVERFGEVWQQCVGAMFQDSVELGTDHAVWWTYVRHFFATPFYVYAYTFGEMLALALFRLYQKNHGGFAPRYIAMLRAGGSLSPQELVEPLGISLHDPDFWRGALDVFAGEVAAFETLAENHLKLKSMEKSR